MECPKDPNARSHFDPNEELNRIQEKKKKKVPNADSYSVKKKFLKMVIRRIKKYETLEDLEQEINKDAHKEWFSDILKYKEQFVVSKPDFKEILKSL